MFYGADTTSVRDHAARCTDGASRVQDIAERLLAAVHGVRWTGPDFDRFAVEALRSTALITAAGAALTDRAAELHLHAEEQDGASTPDSGAGESTIAEISPKTFAQLLQRMAEGDGASAEALRLLFGAEGKSTSEDLGGYLDPEQIDSRSIDLDDIEQFSAAEDLSQGRIGNCWFLASLAAVAEQNPEVIQEHIRLVEGDTPESDYWEVDLWDGSEWVTHEVTQDEIVRDGVRDTDGDITWMTIYERAAVEHMGGEYGDIERNFAGKGFDIVAGDNGSMSLSLSLDSIESKLDEGQSVVTSTPPAIPLIGPADDVVPGHVYVVDEVIRPTDGSEPRIRLINPWGDPHASKPAVLELTQSEYQRSFVSHNSLAH